MPEPEHQSRSSRSRRLVVTVHGIRTFGDWQERLEGMLLAHPHGSHLEIINYKFGYFSLVAFVVPFLRWLVVRRFRKYLMDLCSRTQRERIDLVGHSFGTHIIAWALFGIAEESRPKINTLILSGSVLKSSFPWQGLLGHGIIRVVNDCGIKDSVLLLSQFFVLFTGMAGRLGFTGGTGRHFRNRYFEFGHSGYFLKNRVPDNAFMRSHWLPLLLEDTEIRQIDKRKASAINGVLTTFLNNAEPIKLALYVTPLLLTVIWILGLYVLSDRRRERAEQLFGFAAEQLGDSLIKLGENKLVHDPAAAVQLALSARNLTDSLGAPVLLENAVKKHPVWVTVRAPGTVDACRGELIVPDFQAHAAVVNMEASAIVVSAKTAQTQLLELRAIPSGSLLASRQMEISERVIRADRIAASYFLTKIKQSDALATFRVYGTSAAQFNDPVIEVADLKDAQLTAGGFPLFALSRAGEVLQISKDGKRQIVSTGWEAADSLEVDPSGTSLVLLLPDTLVWLDARPLAQIPNAKFRRPGPSTSRPTNFFGSRTIVRWGLTSNRFVVMEVRQAESGALTPAYNVTVSAFDALVGRSNTIYKQKFAPNGVNNWIFEIGPKFDMVITNVADKGGDTLGAYTLSWRENSDPDVASMTPIKSHLLPTRRASRKPSFPHLARFSPNGDFLTVVRYSKTLSENGNAVDGVGSIESWEVRRLLEQRNESPPIELSVGEVKQLNNAVFEAGTCPITAVGYSQDSSRLVVYDNVGAAHLFEVRPNVVGENQLDTRLQDRYVNRLNGTEVRSFGTNGRFVVALQDDNVYDAYDLQKGKIASSSKLSSPSKALAFGTLDGNELAIFFSSEVIISGARVTRTVKYRKSGDKVLPDKNVVTILSADGIQFYSGAMEFLGPLVMDEAGSALERYLRQLSPSDDRLWFTFGRGSSPAEYFWARSGEGTYRIATTSGSNTIIWEIKRDGDYFRATRLPFGHAGKGDTLQWAPGGQILLINSFANGPLGATSLKQLDPLKGVVAGFFGSPKQGWPRVIAQISGGFELGDKVVFVFRYWPSMNPPRNHFAVGVWPRQGGDNISWRELYTDFVAESLDYISPAGEDVAHIMIRGIGANQSEPLCLVRARDGAKLWSGTAPQRLPAPYLAQRASGLEPIELPFYRRAIQDIRFHGSDYWERITRRSYADLLGDRIGSIEKYRNMQAKLDESPGPWELLTYFFYDRDTATTF